MAPEIIQNIEDQGGVIAEKSLERHLVREITKMMLQKICVELEGAKNAHLIDKWQHDATKVFSLSNKVMGAKNLQELHLLRIV